jgi:hypothetical protein
MIKDRENVEYWVFEEPNGWFQKANYKHQITSTKLQAPSSKRRLQSEIGNQKSETLLGICYLLLGAFLLEPNLGFGIIDVRGKVESSLQSLCPTEI